MPLTPQEIEHEFKQHAHLAALANVLRTPAAVHLKKESYTDNRYASFYVPAAPSGTAPGRPLPPSPPSSVVDQALPEASFAEIVPCPPKSRLRPRLRRTTAAREPNLADVLLGAPLLSERQALRLAEARLKLEACGTLLAQVAQMGGNLGPGVFAAVADAAYHLQQAQCALQAQAARTLCPVEDEGLVFQFSLEG